MTQSLGFFFFPLCYKFQIPGAWQILPLGTPCPHSKCSGHTGWMNEHTPSTLSHLVQSLLPKGYVQVGHVPGLSHYPPVTSWYRGGKWGILRGDYDHVVWGSSFAYVLLYLPGFAYFFPFVSMFISYQASCFLLGYSSNWSRGLVCMLRTLFMLAFSLCSHEHHAG